jgi:2-dehydropantoate 2-reductase
VVGVASATTLAIGAWPRGTSARTTALVQAFTDAGVTEALALAQAKGLSLGPDALAKADQYVARIVATNPAWRPSLLQDLDAGRPLELDAWSGGAVKVGQELGIPTPTNFAIYAGLKPYEHGRV